MKNGFEDALSCDEQILKRSLVFESLAKEIVPFDDVTQPFRALP